MPSNIIKSFLIVQKRSQRFCYFHSTKTKEKSKRWLDLRWCDNIRFKLNSNGENIESIEFKHRYQE